MQGFVIKKSTIICERQRNVCFRYLCPELPLFIAFCIMASKVFNQAKALKELRIHLCPTGKSSEGVRSFIQEHYINVKKQVPNTPILVREAQGIEPKLWARFEYGKEENVSLASMNSSSILNQVKKFISN